MKHKTGLVSGFIFGIVAVFMATLGLVSISVELLRNVLFPIGMIFRGMQFPGIFPLAIVLNGVIFAAVGYVIEKYSSRKVPLYVFGGAVVIVIIAVIIEAMTSGLSA